MTKQEAVNYLRQAAESFKGTWEDHQQLQVALKVVEGLSEVIVDPTTQEAKTVEKPKKKR